VITEWEGWTIPSVAVDTRIEVEIDTSCRSLVVIGDQSSLSSFGSN
jgi:hypothetical protein